MRLPRRAAAARGSPARHGKTERSSRISEKLGCPSPLRSKPSAGSARRGGQLLLIDQTLLPVEFVEIGCRTWRRSGRRSRCCACGARPSALRRRTASAGLADGARRRAALLHPADEVDRLPGHQPPHRREPLLGAGPHEGRAASCAGSRTPGGDRRLLAGRGPGIHEEDRPCAGPSAATAPNCWRDGARRADPLQRRRAGHRRVRHGAGPDLRRRRRASGSTSMPTKPGRCCRRPADGLGTSQRGIR